jgi:hypothetical protein
MGAPKATASPNTNSVGVTTKLVAITGLTADGVTAICTDKSGYEYRVPLLYQRAKGVLPAVGDQWMISQDVLPSWSFLMFMGSSAAAYQIPGAALADSAVGSAQLAAGAVGPAQLAGGTWESLSGLQLNGWAIAADLPVSGYRLRPGDTNLMEFMAAYTCPSAGRADGTEVAALPEAYWPEGTGRLPCGVSGASGPRTDGAAPYLQFSTAGAVVCYGLPLLSSGTMSVYVNGSIRLA